jgi:hypothetical protein
MGPSQKAKEQRGHGVVNLSVQNNALLLKQLDKFYRKADEQWIRLIWQKYYQNAVPHLAREKGSFWWKDILRLHVLYRGVAICLPSRGDTVAFWDDIINGALKSVTFPNLVGYAKDPKASLWKLRNEGNIINCFNIPMSRAAYNEYSYYSNTLIHYHPLTFPKRTLGSSFGCSKFTLPANTISINSKTCC